MSYADIVAQCRRTGKLYEDPDFHAVNSSLFYSRPPPRPFEWKRPKEIVSNAQFTVGGESRFDVEQGMLSDEWLLAAMASLTVNKSLLNKVLDRNEPFDGRNYCGVIRFNLWHEGEWTEVVIDDRLPTYNGKLVFMHSSEQREFWSALLEKAFAKLVGSYEGLKGGQMGEGMCSLTGGIMETFQLGEKAPKDLFNTMLRAHQRASLMGCSIAATDPSKVKAKAPHGLVIGHAYSVTAVKKIKLRTRQGEVIEEMVRVRNPWGNEREWTGAWSDRSSEWAAVADDEKRKIGLTFEDDGEFWMSYTDFIGHFTSLEMCSMSAESNADEGTSKIGYHTFQDTGRWVRGSTAGGCRNFIKSFASNPQYRVKLEDADEDEDDLCTVVVSVIQTGRRELKKRGIDLLTIGFAIYKLEEQKDIQAGVLDKEFFMYNASSERSPQFINSHEVIGRYKLQPGEYVVIPCTFEPNQAGDFLLRIFSENPKPTRRADEETKFERRQSQVARPDEKALDDKFYQFFEKLAGRDSQIDEKELQQLLSTAFKTELESRPISMECCKGIISLYDKEDQGKLGYNDFKTVWMELKRSLNIFHTYDVDKDNDLSTYELRSAFKDSGYQLSNSLLYRIQARYKSSANTINVGDFITAITRMKALYEKLDLKRQGYKSMTLDDIIGACMTL